MLGGQIEGRPAVWMGHTDAVTQFCQPGRGAASPLYSLDDGGVIRRWDPQAGRWTKAWTTRAEAEAGQSPAACVARGEGPAAETLWVGVGADVWHIDPRAAAAASAASLAALVTRRSRYAAPSDGATDVSCVAQNPAAPYQLAVAVESGGVALHDLRGGSAANAAAPLADAKPRPSQPSATFHASAMGVSAVHFAGAQRLWTAGMDSVAAVWDAATGSQVDRIDAQALVEQSSSAASADEASSVTPSSIVIPSVNPAFVFDLCSAAHHDAEEKADTMLALGTGHVALVAYDRHGRRTAHLSSDAANWAQTCIQPASEGAAASYVSGALDGTVSRWTVAHAAGAAVPPQLVGRATIDRKLNAVAPLATMDDGRVVVALGGNHKYLRMVPTDPTDRLVNGAIELRIL
ncbi:hypothetical protein CXG81DRAFT_23655 [Caulochytrium protostelioides]|uniref:WD40 repeat-like protein n=1 Tax=Caulochytrium protostelioides TaxID=1555241 RepID=A0A4P9XDT3_9FUNG|nr:hypothetical protein CXG81DRAFT_23655 [Caulochytrium protostelioides]|eukprot:RKP03684.1 hypothetical protein CXG81DRAFT_23655 [Caulochytrium protostelioides]